MAMLPPLSLSSSPPYPSHGTDLPVLVIEPVRYPRFENLDDVKAKKKDLEGATRAWITLKGG
jgi:hypothetical protein